MIDLRFKPMHTWTEPTPAKQWASPFKMSFDQTLDLLEYELGRLQAKGIIIEAGFDSKDLRNDGWPRPGATPRHGGIILYFQTAMVGDRTADRQMRLPCNTYLKYSANLHAITLTLKHLRAIDRYGVTLGHQQYLGFMIEAPKKMDAHAAALFLSVVSAVPKDYILDNFQRYRLAYRAAAAELHPDKAPEKSYQWQLLQEAKNLLDLHHGQAPAAK